MFDYFLLQLDHIRSRVAKVHEPMKSLIIHHKGVAALWWMAESSKSESTPVFFIEVWTLIHCISSSAWSTTKTETGLSRCCLKCLSKPVLPVVPACAMPVYIMKWVLGLPQRLQRGRSTMLLNLWSIHLICLSSIQTLLLLT